jgi:HSP20 family protein
MQKVARKPEFGDLARQWAHAMDQLIERHMPQFSVSDKWTPAINAFRRAGHIEVCVELAGVEKQSIDIRAEPGLLTIRGQRQAPQPPCEVGEAIQILVMEIDHGPFERTLTLPREVLVDQITAEQQNGMLWLRLPLEEEPAG